VLLTCIRYVFALIEDDVGTVEDKQERIDLAVRRETEKEKCFV
jgi:hypothetical protein